MTRLRLLALVAIVAVLAGACGDKERDPKAEQALAEKAVVTAADLPEGYEAEPEEDEGDDSDSDPLDECLGGEGEELDEAITAEAESSTFQRQSDGTIEVVGSASAVFDSEDDAEEATALFGTDEARDCLDESLEKELASGDEAAVSSAGVEEHDFPTLGDQTTALRLSLSFDAVEVNLPFTMDLVFVREGRVLTLLFFGRLNDPYDVDQAKSIAEKVIARI